MNGQNMENKKIKVNKGQPVFVIDYTKKSIEEYSYARDVELECELFFTHEEAKEHLVKWINDKMQVQQDELKALSIISKGIYAKIFELKTALKILIPPDDIEVMYYRYQCKHVQNNFETIKDAVNYVYYGENDGEFSCNYIKVNGVEIYGAGSIGLCELYNKYNPDEDE
jgi:acyl carrier protein